MFAEIPQVFNLIRFASIQAQHIAIKNKTHFDNRSGFLARREDRIRTCDPVVPNHVFYRAELPPEHLSGCYQPTKTEV